MPSLEKILLTKEDVELINEQFGLDLQYNDADHYRAAQVIWSLWKSREALGM